LEADVNQPNRRNPKGASFAAGLQNAGILPLCLALALFVPAGNRASCQTDLGALTGTVTDSTGAVVPSCSVEAVNVATSYTRTARSDARGAYTIASLPAGAYTVAATAQGFEKLVVTAQVTLNGATGLDLKLQVGKATETVTVSGSSSLATLQTESHEVSQTFVEQQLTQLPINGRNVLNVAVLGPGAQPGSDVNDNGGGAPEFFNMVPNTVFLSGMSNIHTMYLLDGVENLDMLTRAANTVPSSESVQEVNTQVNGASARFDQPSTINMITKSGSDSFHGTAYDFIQNNAVDAVNYFAISVPKQRYNLFGVNLGGPIVKKKLFFFFDYSGLRSEVGSVDATRVPTTDERNGLFDAPGDVPIYDPLTYDPTTGDTQPFSASDPHGNNQIPLTSRIDNFASQFLQYFPTPNVPLVNNINYVTNLNNTTTNDQYLGRLDWITSDKNHVYGSVLRANTPTFDPGIGAGNLQFGTLYKILSTNVSIEDTYVFSPRFVNIARLGFNRMVHFEDVPGAGAENYTTAFGLKNLDPLPSQWAPPFVCPFNYPCFGNPYAPDGGTQNRFQFADEVDYTVGRHSLYAGVDVYRTQFDGQWVVTQNGLYFYDGAFTAQYVNGLPSATNYGNSFADYLLGYGFNDQGATGVSAADFRSYDMSAYIQDDWKVSPTLTLNLGLRYDFENPPVDKNGHSAIWDFATNTPIPGAWNTNYGDLAPRLGFAWKALPKTVLRGGAGIYYAPNIYNWLQAELLYSPNWISQSPVFTITDPTLVEDAFVANPPTAGQSPYTLTKRLPDTSAQQWNLGVERELGMRMLASVTYTGMVGKHIQLLQDGNQPLPTGPIPYNTRPDPGLSSAVQVGNFGWSNYNGLLASLSGNPVRGLTTQASYTWSKSMDLADGDDAYIENEYRHRLTYAFSGWDRTNNFVLSSVYELPFGPGKQMLNSDNAMSRFVTGGWQVGEVYHLASGEPTSVTANNETDTGFLGEMFADKVCNPKASRVGLQWFNPNNCFIQPPPGTYGAGGRNGVRNPRNNILDFSAVKNFTLYTEHQIQFRAEAFNLLNHPVLSLGGSQGVTSPSLGVLSVAGPARVLQFALRYSF
jgi:Carboxypeptidase regulatory-like domain/TonB dependent receptor